LLIDRAVDKDQAILLSGEILRAWLGNPEKLKLSSGTARKLVDSIIRCADENSRLVSSLQALLPKFND